MNNRIFRSHKESSCKKQKTHITKSRLCLLKGKISFKVRIAYEKFTLSIYNTINKIKTLGVIGNMYFILCSYNLRCLELKAVSATFLLVSFPRLKERTCEIWKKCFYILLQKLFQFSRKSF